MDIKNHPYWTFYDEYLNVIKDKIPILERELRALEHLALHLADEPSWITDLIIVSIWHKGWATKALIKSAFHFTDEQIQACIERHTERIANLRLEELASMPYRDYLQTPEWQERRKRILERDDFSCLICDATEHLNVHHRTYDRRGNEHDGDLITLCQTCHQIFHENGRLAVEVEE